MEHQGESGRGLSPAGVIEVIAIEWRAPVFEYAHELSLLEVRGEFVFGKKCDTEALERCDHHVRRGVANNLTCDAHICTPTPPFELPGVEATSCRKPHIDAAVSEEVAWLCRLGL